ncbi:hypothetical protein V9T40_012103 [Parthenolecanium corni]|uniref:Uncharacterized protein n=1 Tax=Parthenolecanium corni TaxID=536013 RepID=A0AAN9TJU7_9HEMI
MFAVECPSMKRQSTKCPRPNKLIVYFFLRYIENLELLKKTTAVIVSIPYSLLLQHLNLEIQFTLSADGEGHPETDAESLGEQKNTPELKTDEDSKIKDESFNEHENATESIKIEGDEDKIDSDSESGADDAQQVSSDEADNSTSSTTVTPDGAEKNLEEATTNVDETEEPLSIEDMKKKAAASRDDAIKKAKLALQKVKTETETLKRKSEKEFDEDIEKSLASYKKVESILNALEKKSSYKIAQARKKIRDEYNETVTAAEEKLKNAKEAYNAAYQAAYEELEKAERQFEENKEKFENDNREALEEVRKKKETVQKLAEERKEKAYAKYQKAMETKMSPKKKEKAKAEYQKEINKYEEALEMADEEYEEALNSIGLIAALDDAVKQFQEAEDRAELMLANATEEHNRILQEAEEKRQEAEKLAIAEKAKEDEKYETILNNAENQHDIRSKKIWKIWKNIQNQANEELTKASAEFYKTKKHVTNEYLMASEQIERNEKEPAKLAKVKSVKTGKKIPANSKDPASRRQMQDRDPEGSNAPSKQNHSLSKVKFSRKNSVGGGGGGGDGGESN